MHSASDYGFNGVNQKQKILHKQNDWKCTYQTKILSQSILSSLWKPVSKCNFFGQKKMLGWINELMFWYSDTEDINRFLSER